MQQTLIPSSTSLVRFGMARADITPPVGIYHRMWGAARHDRAAGVHRPSAGDVVIFEPREKDRAVARLIRVQLDHVGLAQKHHQSVVATISQAGDVPPEQVIVTYSHTHSGGVLLPDRFELPGGDLIVPYLDDMNGKLRAACVAAIEQVEDVTITYATGWSDMAANRDCWDEEFNGYVCGYNPDESIDNRVLVGRVTDEQDALRHVFVHYACHPTTLAWENDLLSPDFVGALREEVERHTGTLCTYFQGPCGEIGPRNGQQGDTAVADRNGQQLAFAALSAIASLGAPSHDFQYQGPVISGATLGTWKYTRHTGERIKRSARFDGGRYTVELPVMERPDPADLERDRVRWVERQKEADQQGDTVAARDYGARAERAKRWLGRLASFPDTETYTMSFSIYRMGDAVWVTCGGEPYHMLQTELSRRFPQWTIVVSPLDCAMMIAYLLPEDRYGKGLYQEEPSPLAKGCLERLLEAISSRMEEVVEA